MADTENDLKNQSARYVAEPVKDVVPPSAKQIRNRLLLVIATVVALCIAASKDLISLFGF